MRCVKDTWSQTMIVSGIDEETYCLHSEPEGADHEVARAGALCASFRENGNSLAQVV